MERNLRVPTLSGLSRPFVTRRQLGNSILLPGQRDATPPAGVRVMRHLAESLILPSQLVYNRGSSLDLALAAAYRACTEIIRRHSRSFYFSSRLLPAAKRQSIMALYAFCRTSDDLVDADFGTGDRECARECARLALDSWSALVSGSPGKQTLNSKLKTQNSKPYSVLSPHSSNVVRAWTDTRTRHGIPSDLPDELLAGVRMDLTISRYETWDDLWLYCYRVASTVGLMSMYVMGADTPNAIPYAVQLGVALQLTNILRDVGEDARSGRIYLPLEEMKRFGYTEEMLLSGVVNRSFVALMDFQIARAHALYCSALPGVALLSADSRLAVMAAATVYRGILDRIVAARYDVFNHRAHLSTTEKLRSLPAIWWRAKRGL